MPATSSDLAKESVWFERSVYEKAEEQYVKFLTQPTVRSVIIVHQEVPGASLLKQCQANLRPSPGKSSLADEIARARQHIKHSLQCDSMPCPSAAMADDVSVGDCVKRVDRLDAENKTLLAVTEDLKKLVQNLEARIRSLEKGGVTSQNKATAPPPVAKAASAPVKKDADDDIDLFGSDEEDDEDKEKLHQERLKAYEEKKSKKPGLIAKSNIILDVKPWDDETDMKKMESEVRGIAMDGLKWGASKLVPLAFGIHKLQISCVVEDDKVSVDLLQEQIESMEDLVQSVDIAAFNKV